MATIPGKYTLALLPLWFGVWLAETYKSSPSMDDDLLLPYARGHGPSHSHRHVRECQPVVHGNVTYETWKASNHTGAPVAESTVFVSDVLGKIDRRWVYGHMTVVRDPLQTVSVLEPGGPGGCGMHVRASVEETSRASACLYAQNAGFFNTNTGHCLGNVVSEGRLLQDSGGVQNAQFGIRRDGTLVFGYLSEEDVLNEVNPFIQLVSGVIWLLRDGQVYIEQSLKAECQETQMTGTLRRFVDVVSARSAVGHDQEGNLILFHIDGQTDVRGMNLWDVANFLKSHGVVNAINLDGGGSTTYVVNGSLASYPSDQCILDKRWRCPRQVSTILCVHQRLCQPHDCSGHGACVDGLCQCQDGWHGTACSSLVCERACSAHGLCTADGCVCDAGWRGQNCSQECMPGFYGDRCNQTCTCDNGGSCDPVHGHCSCPPGFQGDSCQQACPLGFYGPSCRRGCQCQDMCPCDPITGGCNTSIQGERNQTFHQVGHCLAKQLFTTWRQESQPYLTERMWLMITVSLASLLSASLVAHLILACRKPGAAVSARPFERQDYSYVPLNDINGDKPRRDRARDHASQSGQGALYLEDSDSDELWSPPR